MIVTIASYAFAIPGVLYSYIKMGVFSNEVDVANLEGSFRDPVYLLLNLISTIAQLLLSILSIIGIALVYFNLNEHKNFTGTYEQIDNLGERLDD